jgi:hypothetical protein
MTPALLPTGSQILKAIERGEGLDQIKRKHLLARWDRLYTNDFN